MGAMSLKAKIRNMAKQKNIPAQVILQNYMFERFLFRLSKSEYKDKFIIKGGMLVAAVVGLDNRATMDLDTTLANLPLNEETITKAMTDICKIPSDDETSFLLTGIMPIRDDDVYGGYRVSITSKYDTVVTPLSVDISTGDVITPSPVKLSFGEIFEDKSFELWAYSIETVLAEKIETILRRGVFNTRPRDFYDAYILSTTQKFSKKTFEEALNATASHRGTSEQIKNTGEICDILSQSKELNEMWEKYREQFGYAQEIKYSDIINVIKELLEINK